MKTSIVKWLKRVTCKFFTGVDWWVLEDMEPRDKDAFNRVAKWKRNN